MDTLNQIDLEPIMVSTLEHYSYCPRQCALIHREQTYDENLYTLRGRAAHERVDEPDTGLEQGIRTERALPIWSSELGLVGRADVVEFHGDTPYPVEYKYGRHSAGRHADLQLCAQAICLEEMLGVPVPRGAIFQVSSRKRREVEFTPELRERAVAIVQEVRRILDDDTLPPPVADARCDNCSLNQSCMPSVIARKSRSREAHRELYLAINTDDPTDGRSS
ncbi:MAG: CRISPR-associated protein Cas4 [Chloroflexi bacterium]|nr:CRISPR-associated protein Cas4 [Chloroflexota bacterium]